MDQDRSKVEMRASPFFFFLCRSNFGFARSIQVGTCGQSFVSVIWVFPARSNNSLVSDKCFISRERFRSASDLAVLPGQRMEGPLTDIPLTAVKTKK